MTRRYIYKFLKIILCVLNTFLILFFIKPVNIDISRSNKVMSFAVLSDVHINESNGRANNNFKNALNILLRREANLSAVFVAGDLTDNGYENQYKEFNNTYISNSYSVPLYAVMGNHDYWNGLSEKESQKLFVESTKQELRSHEIINGLHFLKLSTENGEVNGYYSNEALKWLDSELSSIVSKSSSSPIFVVTHHPSKNTVYGSGVFGNEELSEVLKKYHQVIHFSGHSHYTLDDERSILQEDYTMINTASVSYGGTEVDGSIEKIMDLSAGLLVNVYDDNTITVEKINFTINDSIKDKWFIKDTSNKSNYTYIYSREKDRALPYFEKDSKINVKNIDSNSCVINFQQGIHSDYVHAYKIEIYDKEVKKNISTFYTSAKHYYGKKQPKELEVSINNLTHNTEYEVRIYAQESFGKLSEDYLCLNFKTENEKE